MIQEENAVNIQKLKLKDLNPAPYNPRKELKPGDPEFEKLKNSIEHFGYVELIVVNAANHNTVISGHQRLAVLKHLGVEEVECVVVELDEVREKALNVAMNKVSGEWDKDKLALVMSDLQAADFDVAFTGFDPDEIAELLGKKGEAKEDNFDVDAAVKEPPFVKSGDIWTLGRHRLMCGDSTKPDDFTLLMDGNSANLCVTDSPYNCDYEGGTGMKIMNDKMSGEDFKRFLHAAFTNIYNSLVDGGCFYAFHSDAEKVNFFQATVDAGFHYSTTCIWVKNSLVIGRSDYQQRHEPVIYAFKDTAKHKWYSDRKQTTVWEFDRPTKSKLHPTMKPLPLVAYPIENSSAPNGIVLDCFGGSGTTLIACEQMNRICFMMELDPIYATVIVKRYAQQVGSTENISLLRDGKVLRYDEVPGTAELSAVGGAALPAVLDSGGEQNE